MRPPTAPILLLALLLQPWVAAGEGADVALVRRLLEDPSPSARAAALRRLSGSEGVASLRLLLDRLEDPHPYVRRAAAGVLGTAVEPAVRRWIATEVPRARGEVARFEAGRVFALWADEEGWRHLRILAADRSPSVRGEARRWLAEEPSEETTALLLAGLRDPDPGVRAESIDALAGRRRDLLPEALFSDPDPRVRLSALEAVVPEGGDPAATAVARALADPSWSVRAAAASIAPQVRDRRVLLPLARALADERRRVSDAAHRALVGLTGIPFDPSASEWIAWLEGDGKDFDPASRPPDLRPRRPSREEDPGGRTVAAARFMDHVLDSVHVAFVIDGSGSMAEPVAEGETRWDRARRELGRALDALPGALVNLHRFADEAESVWPRAERLGPARRAEAGRWLAERPPGGKTALYDGIAAGLADPEVDLLVVLSDGAPSAGAFFTKTDLLAEVRRQNRWRRARIDVISVGADAVAVRWRDLLVRIAQESGGVWLAR
jgi:hypothetical protein